MTGFLVYLQFKLNAGSVEKDESAKRYYSEPKHFNRKIPTHAGPKGLLILSAID